MNLQNILSEIENVDPEVYERLDTRRASLHSFSGIGKKIALTALPFALGGLFKKAYGQTSSMPSVVDILNYALTLEFLESEFYKTAVGTTGLIASSEVASFTTIRDHEVAHVADLQATINSLGGTPKAKPSFDFTAGGAFSDVFSNYDTFLAVSQTFEDTGVRAYKGQANNANLMANNAVLDAALQIHSVEARHASHVRYVRRIRNSDTTIKGWITGNMPTIAAVAASYAGEDNTLQGGVNITTLSGVSGNISASVATEAFDEPLNMTQVLAIVKPFIK
ncbi:MAG: ferritin-like domain-containing protein [Bacteroidota bacterium]|nr:ferritin-like domain-containing protein [Bacteroidota bacterium]